MADVDGFAVQSCTAAPVVPPAPAQSLAKKTPKSKSGKGKKAGSSGIGSKVKCYPPWGAVLYGFSHVKLS